LCIPVMGRNDNGEKWELFFQSVSSACVCGTGQTEERANHVLLSCAEFP
jgi:hypothetical protein